MTVPEHDLLRRRACLQRLAMLALSSSTVGSSLAGAAETGLLRRTTHAGRMPEYSVVGDKTLMYGVESIRVEGIGLVVGLRGTGSDPPPNKLRDQMLEEMKRREVENPKKLLGSSTTSLVLLRAFIPPGARKGDAIDVEVWVPPGDDTSSLRGGWLMESTLKTMVISKQGARTGADYVRVEGPVLISGEVGNSVADLKGKILGNGRLLMDQDFRIMLDSSIRSAKRTREMAYYINQRFRSGGSNPADLIANARTDNRIDLKLYPAYHYDVQRFLLITRFIPLSGSRTFLDGILPALQDALLRPTTTIEASMRLEAIGRPAVTVLQAGLESSSESIRFASAQALAYVGDASGAKILGQIARDSIEFRAQAIAALVALDHAQARLQLSLLLNSPGAETRYGAFRAMWARDPNDPTIRGESINGLFNLHIIDSRVEPMVHIARNFRPEIAIFGRDIQLKAPMSLRAGADVMITAQTPDQVFVTGIVRTSDAPRKETAISSPNLADVIRHVGKLGGTYPDVVEMLQQAKQQGNLTARLEVNALPKSLSLATQEFIAASEDSQRNNGKIEEASRQLPSLFTVFSGDAPKDLAPLRQVSGKYESPTEEKPGPLQRLMFWKRDD